MYGNLKWQMSWKFFNSLSRRGLWGRGTWSTEKNEIKDESEFQKSHDKAIGSRGMLIFKK